jgi:hypothetical protein
MSSNSGKGAKKVIKSNQNDKSVDNVTNNTTSDNIVSIKSPEIVEKKKRGRKKQNVAIEITEHIVEDNVKPAPKKRGRKPKGGKIIQQTIVSDNKINNETNVILHLKCSLNDINNNDVVNNYPNKYTYDPSIENIQSFHFDNPNVDNFLISDLDNNIIDQNTTANVYLNTNEKCNTDIYHDDKCKNKIDNTSIKNEIWEKLNLLKVNLHNNNVYDKRSACFWCTYDFDNPPIFIPKNEFKDTYQVYGCFCSPECSVAHLMNEKIDSSIKFERYQLLNHIYGKIYNYTKNIKPAPNPHYVLEKFYGTLSIKEYRELFKTDQLLIVVDKPLTHVFPELYEDNSDFILNQRTIPSNSTFKLKRKISNEKKNSVLDTLNANKL